MNKPIPLTIPCITYGSPRFNPSRFNEVTNSDWRNKPECGGLWTSPVNSNYGWRQWCEDEQFDPERLTYHFTFTFQGTAIVIDVAEHLLSLDWFEQERPSNYGSARRNYSPDFEAMARKGIDAIFLTEKGQWETRTLSETYTVPNKIQDLYGWDVECLLILNKKAVRYAA